MFSITGKSGFHITFENGITISIQFSEHNYCDNKTTSYSTMDNLSPNQNSRCENAEIAIWDKKNNWITQDFTEKSDSSGVAGWVDVEEVFEIIDRIREVE